MNRSNAFTFVANPQEFLPAQAYVARITANVNSAQKLLDVLYSSLNLPGYFGFNWNALYDCLRDLDWTKQKLIVIVHESLPELTLSDLQAYLEVLEKSATSWRPGESHELQVVFNETDRARIDAIISASSS